MSHRARQEVEGMLMGMEGRENRAVDTVNAPTAVTGTVHMKVKFEVFGEEMIEKSVNSSGNSGRVYLPTEWVVHRVKIIRVD